MKTFGLLVVAAALSLGGCGGGWDMPWEDWPPSAPRSLSVKAISASDIEVTWEASQFREGGYRVYRDGLFYMSVGTTRLVDGGLNPNTRHCYAVTAYSKGGESEPTATLCDTTFPFDDTSPPTAPALLNAVASSATGIDLTWEASTDDIAVDFYNVYRGGAGIANTTALSFGDTGLAASTEYCYNVTAVDKAGNESQQSNTACATTLAQ